ncbi:MerR family transcriptional regulator [Actinokineospora terrae]|uniref:DNA-binding transcriptional regulator, MerR family n=1 Tax=Actinokineospora terrae TaxID=155974 RepID=A0A1H9XIM1_9PSEU|nr:MerR family transcriptional regulator [Actinokineospora terrae]SES45513.1 DNA-binding transcriptional regulator, MerR family [Actinokineospora terrae]
MTERTWRVGELAEATGLSVRALHHYDQLGLLTPSRRNTAGHRLYIDADVRRLHQIVALRGFGLTLTEVARLLAGDLADPRELIRQQLEQVEATITAAQQVRRKLVDVLDGLSEPSAQTLLDLVERMTTMDRRLTHEEFDALNRERQAWRESLSPEQFAEHAERRRQATAAMTDEQLREMRERRAALVPQD